MKKLLLLLLFTSFTAISQITYQPGYFIDNSGNKTECLIKNTGWKNTPTEFSYKLNENDEPKINTIKTVKEFSVESHKFLRFNVDIDRPSSNVTVMSSPEPEWKKETLFLKVLVEGSLNLYQYEDGKLMRYFFSKSDHSKPEQLVYRKYKIKGETVYNSNGSIKKDNNAFQEQLYNNMKDKISNIERFIKISYKKDDLVKIFVEYNTNDDLFKDFTATQNKGSLHLKITPGINFATFKVSNELALFKSLEFSDKTIFRLGAELEYVLPYNRNKWSLFIDPNFQQYKNKGNVGPYDLEMNYTFIQLPIGARHYMYLNDQSKLFLDIAFAMSFAINDSKLSYYDSVTIDLRQTSTFVIGAGYNYKRYSAEVRYAFNDNPLENEIGWEANLSSVGIILGYRIF
ncbi:hypothetical protein [Flavobacterium sp. MK4S-17]|uniref:hypothetical protein n=1 Tax=Flavobacterium sp. MK4S-17 TaxID=2543737 RepID=UPI00135B9FE1|nr:hypothetical protein [Flavobacterium sp. MK4S-17]